jgi:tetratricopeptide (TPR) repeat protein
VADIFVSYTGSDRDWAFWMAKELEALGHTPHVHEWEINSGDDIYAWMEQRHEAADHVLCVVSDEYLKAPYSTLERNAALWQAAGRRPGFVLFVVVKPSKLPTLSDHIRRCELFGVPEDAARLRFREFMQKREAPATAAFPGKVFAVSNIPIRVPEHFLGREDSLAAIAAALGRYEGRVAITALHGLRGVGKTTLAAAYAERHRGDYRATWWIRAQTDSGMRADLAALGVRLGWVSAEAKEDAALAAVMERLRHEGEGILLIFDNAMDAASLKSYLPRGGAAGVLVTSNAHAWRGVASPVEIRLWPTEIGADYFIARTGREQEREAAAALSDALGGLPLAHEQAAAYCERLEISLGEYHKRFEATPARLLDSERDAPIEYHDRLTVAKTFALAIEEAAKSHPAAEPLIAHAALLAPEPIPLFIFREAREKLGEPLASLLANDGLDEAVAALRAFALIDRPTIVDEHDPTITTETIRLHRLVQRVAQSRRDGKTREAAQGALVSALVAVYPDEVWSDPKTWPRARRLDALAIALVGSGDGLPRGTEVQSAALINELATYRTSALAAYNEARSLYERALAIREKELGPDDPATAGTLSDFGILLGAQGRLAEARTVAQRALAIKEKALGPDHWVTATSLNNLAIVLQQQGDLEAARPLRERSLAIFEKTLGPEHFRTANNINNLAVLLQAQGDLNAARPLLERALAIREKVLGPDHPHTAWSLNSLGNLLAACGDATAARPLYERALAIGENALGPEHPETAISLNNLGRLLTKTGEPEKAAALLQRAIAISDKVLGPDHATTQRYKCNYARLLLDTGHADEAHILAAAALAAHAEANGPRNNWTKDSASVTADALDALGRGDEAAEVREKYGFVGEVSSSPAKAAEGNRPKGSGGGA